MKDGAIAIVGAGQAGGWAAITLRQEGFDGPVVLIGAEVHAPYERPPLSKSLLAGSRDLSDCAIKPEDFYRENGVELRLGCRVEEIDRKARKLRLSDGASLAYRTLILATGARARTLAPPGADKGDVHYLRTIEDALAIRRHLREGARVALIGGGYIGLEVAATATSLGCDVTVIEALPEILTRAMPRELGQHIAAEHRKKGVRIETSRRVDRIEFAGGNANLMLDDGQVVTADLVIAGVGAVPVSEIADAAGIDCDDGILTDEFGQTSDSAVFAAGDVTRHYNPLIGRHIRLESWQNAQNQAIATARNVLGASTPYAEIPWFWSDQFEMNIQAVGLADQWDEVVVRADPAGQKIVVFCLANGVMLSAFAINSARDIRYARQLIAGRSELDRAALADKDIPLKALLAR